MADPRGFRQFPDGIKLAPTAVDNLPSDAGDMVDAGTPYVAVVLRHSTVPNAFVIRWVVSSAGTLASGYGNNYGNDFGGPA